jgi:hypothetical protein
MVTKQTWSGIATDTTNPGVSEEKNVTESAEAGVAATTSALPVTSTVAASVVLHRRNVLRMPPPLARRPVANEQSIASVSGATRRGGRTRSQLRR